MRGLRRLCRSWWGANPLSGLDAEAWLKQVRAAAPAAIAIVHPHWRGVTSATTCLFPDTLPVSHKLTARWVPRVAELLLESQVPRVVLGAFSPGLVPVVEYLHRVRPSLPIYALCFSNLMQCGERTAWQALQRMVELAKAGKIQRVGCAKAGLAELLQSLGAPAAFLASAGPGVPTGPAQPRAGGPHFGLWAVNAMTWRKLPFAMLAAARSIPGARVHMTGGDGRVAEFARFVGLPVETMAGVLPHAEMARRMAGMHLNLYVTLSECAPMVPLESLAVGVPCLFGPNSHLLEDDAYLHSRLVVPYPERHEVIARYIERALDERDAIVTAYRAYAPGYWQRCRDTVTAFLELSPGEARGILPLAA